MKRGEIEEMHSVQEGAISGYSQPTPAANIMTHLDLGLQRELVL